MKGNRMEGKIAVSGSSIGLLALACYSPTGSVNMSASTTMVTSGADVTTDSGGTSRGELMASSTATSSTTDASTATATTQVPTLDATTTTSGPGSSSGLETTTNVDVFPCGNGVLDDGEACDDANEITTDACIFCNKAVCGDGYTQVDVEMCDDGGESPSCNADCSGAVCGDYKTNVSAGEVCDSGAKNGTYNGGCAADCGSLGVFCGDGLVSAPEEKCDVLIPLANATCADGCNGLLCAKNFADCDGILATGCEVNVLNDNDHCGNCATKCGVLDHCEIGKCTF